MITTVTMNPCIDWTVRVPSVTLGGLNLVDSTRTDVCGKGVNVAIVLRELGLEAMCTGISFTENGSLLEERLDGISIPHSFVMAPGSIRTNIKVMDASQNQMTELNSRGNEVADSVLEAFLQRLEALAEQSRIVTISGRIPNGAGTDIYRRCLERLARHNVKTVLDAEGEPFRLALEAAPYLVKPNSYELETAFGRRARNPEEVVQVVREEITARGVQVACVSMGGGGAVLVDSREAFYAPALDIEPQGFQGAGDSMVAGLCRAMEEGVGLAEMLAMGTAAAAGSLIREGTLLCRKKDFEAFLPQVKVTKV